MTPNSVIEEPDDGKDVLARNIKANKEIIILSLISKNSICGIDLIKEIFLKANVFLSPGTVYPILYSFGDAGILKVKHETGDMRTKIYSLTPKGKESLAKKIEYLANATSFVNDLVSEKRRIDE
jgi:DNA-binding PadR family transcriptional regulator